jgi:hypothetical protein
MDIREELRITDISTAATWEKLSHEIARISEKNAWSPKPEARIPNLLYKCKFKSAESSTRPREHLQILQFHQFQDRDDHGDSDYEAELAHEYFLMANQITHRNKYSQNNHII